MAVTIVVGGQWGDEGKGKIVDMLAQRAQVVVRFNGGNNAGHTIINPEVGEIALHLIPAGIFNPETYCLIEKGAVIHLLSLVQEMKLLEERAVSLAKLKISPLAHLVMPWHIAEDQNTENQNRESDAKIGTTLRGIGPCYEDKAGRRQALRVADLRDKEHFLRTIERIYAVKERELAARFGNANLPLFEETRQAYLDARDYALPYIDNTSRIIDQALNNNQGILLEGAQGTLLDVDFGTYPYVTSSSTMSMAACHLTGVSPKAVTRIIGVVKAYVTRVGEGPFPTEIKGEDGERLRELGREYGATTGRPRRCGWLDLPLVRYAARLNHFTEIALTKLDILGLMPRILLCRGYKRIKGELREFEFLNLKAQQPEYQEFSPWGNLEQCGFRDELPKEARDYIKEIERQTKTPVSLISKGGARKEIIAL